MTKDITVIKSGFCTDYTNCGPLTSLNDKTCVRCGSLLCDKHAITITLVNKEKSTEVKVCIWCKDLPDGYGICMICDCPTISRLSRDNPSFSNNIGFYGTDIRNYFDVDICDYCHKTHVIPLNVKDELYDPDEADKVHYFTLGYMYRTHILLGSNYKPCKKFNDSNNELILKGRNKILEYYKETIPLYILPDVAKIIIEYCGFARFIEFYTFLVA